MAEPNPEFLEIAKRLDKANKSQTICSHKLSLAISGMSYQIQRLNVSLLDRPLDEQKIPLLLLMIGCLENYNRRVLAAAASFDNLQEKVGRELDEENSDFNNSSDCL